MVGRAVNGRLDGPAAAGAMGSAERRVRERFLAPQSLLAYVAVLCDLL